jgi:cytochrome P450
MAESFYRTSAGSMLDRPATAGQVRIPPGPSLPYDPKEDLLCWMNHNFDRYGDVFRASIFGRETYVVRDPQYAQHILRKNWNNYRKGMAIKRIGLLLGSGLMVSEGEFWTTQRRMIQPVFERKTISRFADLVITANKTLLQKWISAAHKKENVNVTRDISLMVLEVILVALFGDDYERLAPYFILISDVAARDLQFAQRFRSLGNVVAQLIGERRRQDVSATDILGVLIAARDRKNGKPMLDRQIVSEIMTLVVAGHETTASTLNWTWYLLSQNPSLEEKLSRELELQSFEERDVPNHLAEFTYTRQVLEEALRLYPAGWLMTRKALKDDRLGDWYVPARTEIYISPYFIQRHPALWEAPDRFNPDRFIGGAPDRRLVTTLPFSAGPRNCIGELFARFEMQIHLIMVAKQLRLRCIDDTPPEIEAGVNLRSKRDIIMKLETKMPRSHHDPRET